MTRMNLLLMMLFSLGLAGCQAEKLELHEVTDTTYEVGQKWNYRTPPGQELSYLLVTRVEEGEIDGETRTIVHVYIEKLSIEHPDGGTITSIPHMPFTKEALSKSVYSLFEYENDMPDTEEAYRKWREAYERGEASVFDVSVEHAINSVIYTAGQQPDGS
ncbi:MAG: hypothetical protein L0332_27540 [Chloroflexi bacterium]|nr:hypothetical protein [Chloroflexota bacterium]MCI0578984.1 hypothetical protein [Chloroflexota bacterium]MCI0644635.1 hypothetical protein [Chloroflexota bacterium]MCI0730452.1 hypothetical protein [Chloroflexota bacterium]